VVHEGSSSPLTGAAGQFPALTKKDEARTAQVSIGQGEMLVTPLHMALVAGAIGRNGIAWKPRLATATPPEPLTPFLPSKSASVLADMMRHAVVNGTGRAADLPGLQVAGKTGTAQNPHGADHGWFVGFAPATQPRVAFAVLVEQGGYGSQSALPVAVAVLRKAQAEGLFGGPP
jgi:peptidoglycan glycosyltransferase